MGGSPAIFWTTSNFPLHYFVPLFTSHEKKKEKIKTQEKTTMVRIFEGRLQ
jgi:hypothetical protein